MRSLVLTLGHNASAILVDDGLIYAGFEEERLSGIKSDSQFPLWSIMRLRELYSIPRYVKTCVGHWFLDGQLPLDDPKHWRPDLIRQLFPDTEILSLNPSFTHHDSHLESAEVFVGDDFPSDHHVFVMDGFGTQGEVISVYHVKDKTADKVLGIYGFHNSLGLMYQYATAFCGMKPHQHEYKMLAYEAHIDEVVGDTSIIDVWIDEVSHHSFKSLINQRPESQLPNLMNYRDEVYHILQNYLDYIGLNRLNYADLSLIRNRRIAVSYFVQRHVENVVRDIFTIINPTNLVVTGGLFLNVKVNSMLCDMVPGKFSAMPLAGDQGAGLGVYQHHFGDLKWPGHLFWGQRDEIIKTNVHGIVINGGIEDLRSQLYGNGMVNLVRGPMEFGPRTLCHTSTLAIPTMENTVRINQMNGRTTEMPFGLVVTQKQAEVLFKDIDKVHKSLEYMILTRDFQKGRQMGLEGGAHHYPLQDRYTCRPQITYDHVMFNLVSEFGPLINTSMNVHGQPIVYDQKQIEYAHMKERETFPITTVIMKG